MQKKYQDLTKNVFLFSISGFVPKILSFILVPIYTSYLTTAEYGIADLLTVTVTLLIPIFTLDIQDAVMRFALDKTYNNKDIFSTAFKIIMSGFALVLLGTWVVSKFNLPGVDRTYLIFFALTYLFTASYSMVALFCRGIDKVNVMVVSSILNSVIMLSANILFLVLFGWGLTGYLAANAIGSAVALIYVFWGGKLYQYIKWSVTTSVHSDMIAFSFPLIFSVIAWWVNNASDRYILTWMSGVAVSGIFAVAYKIPNLLSMFQNIFAQAWSISVIKEFDKNDTDGFIGNMYTTMNFSMIVICSTLMLFNIPIAHILYSKDFFAAREFVPPLLISVVFNTMALFIGGIFTAVKDTKTLSVSTILGATVNIILNLVFIYRWGAYGAAVATMMGYAATLIFRHIILRKYIRIHIKMGRVIIAYVLLIFQMMISKWGLSGMWCQSVVLMALIALFYKEIVVVKNLILAKIKSL